MDEARQHGRVSERWVAAMAAKQEAARKAAELEVVELA